MDSSVEARLVGHEVFLFAEVEMQMTLSQNDPDNPAVPRSGSAPAITPDEIKYADERTFYRDTPDDERRAFTMSALDFLSRAQNRRCVRTTSRVSVQIPRYAPVEIAEFVGQKSRFVMAMWQVPIDMKAIERIRSTEPMVEAIDRKTSQA